MRIVDGAPACEEEESELEGEERWLHMQWCMDKESRAEIGAVVVKKSEGEIGTTVGGAVGGVAG